MNPLPPPEKKTSPDRLLRILHLGKKYPPALGGVESVTRDLVEGLNEFDDLSLDVLCSHEAVGQKIKPNPFFFEEKNAPPEPAKPAETKDTNPGKGSIVKLPTWFDLFSTSFSPALPGVLRSAAPHYDIIHLHHPNPMTTFALLRSGYSGKIVTHWHSDILKRKPLLRLYKPLQRKLLERSHAVITTSPPYGEHSRALRNFRDKIRVIPIGIDPEPPLFSGDEPPLLRRLRDKKIIFGLGRLVPYKGFPVLIRAARLLPENHAVIIGGSGPQKKNLEALIRKLGLEEKVFLPGSVSREELPIYYRRADLFCLPSLNKAEAFGVVLLEAMRRKLPLVTSRPEGSGVSWVNQDGESGLTARTDSPSDLADKILMITGDPEKHEKFSEDGFRRFNRLFTKDAMLRKTADLYRELCSGT